MSFPRQRERCETCGQSKPRDPFTGPQAWRLHVSWLGRNLYAVDGTEGLFTLAKGPGGGEGMAAKLDSGATAILYHALEAECRVKLALGGHFGKEDSGV